ncbi:MAG TPA: hypothetical protein VF139_01420 [Candidatus Polarisedimenticolaceae bacterium]
MNRLVSCCVLLAGGAGFAAAAEFAPAGETVRTATILSAPASYDRPSADRFTTLSVDARCSSTVKRANEITLGWKVKREGAQAFRVDVSEFRDGFITGRYLTSGARPATQNAIVLEAAAPGVFYYWRLLVRSGEDWVHAANGRFDSPICPYDGDREGGRE